jgi:hypothetical protein
MNKIESAENASYQEHKKLAFKENKEKILKKLDDLVQSSTSHGLPNIFRTKRLLIKILWTVCFSVALGFCLYMVYNGFIDYFKYETVSKTEYITEIPSIFPTVSICSVNPLSTADAQSLVEKKLNEIGYDPTKNLSLGIINYLGSSNMLALLEASNPDYGDENRRKLGLNIESFMFCFYDEAKCLISETQWYFDPVLGNCYRFNSGFGSTGHSIPLKETIKPGVTNGLIIYIYLENAANKYSFASSEGLRVFIHNSSANPSDASWVDIKLSEMTNIAIKRTFIQKEPDPYSDCIDLDTYDSEYYRFIIENTNKAYKQEDCYNLCLQKNIIENCKCYSLYYPKLYESKPCLNITQRDCYIKEYLSFKTKTLDDNCAKLCPLECESVMYDLVKSSSNYPTEYWFEIFKDLFPNTSYSSAKERVLGLNIFYSQMSYTRISESPKISSFDLMSNMGGTLGLYIGISFLSFIEIVEMILEVIFISFNR